MESALGVELGRVEENDMDGCEDIALVRSGISSNISKYCSTQAFITIPSVIFWGPDFPGTLWEGTVADVVARDEWGIVHIWVSRVMLEPETKFGVKHIARLAASILFVAERSETS